MTMETIPVDYDAEDPRYQVFSTWFPRVLFDFFNLEQKLARQREYAVLQYRYGLDGRSKHTLEEIGIIYDVTRERIRQIQNTALAAFRKLIIEGHHEKRRARLQPDLYAVIAAFRANLANLPAVITERRMIEFAKSSFETVNIDLPYFRFLLEILNLRPIVLGTRQDYELLGWVLGDVDIKKLELVLELAHTYLRESVVTKPYVDIKLAINRSSKKRITDDDLGLALQLSDDIEQLDDGTYQIRYERLRTMADKAYRLMHNRGEPIHARDLARVLNKLEVSAGNTSNINAHHVGSRLSADPRFEPIGRSGEWILKVWEDINTETVLELMTEALHAAAEPLSSQQIFEYVTARRPAKRQAIDSYLSNEARFSRVGRDQYALADWGMDGIQAAHRERRRFFTKAKLCEVVKEIFEDLQVSEMYMADLAREIEDRIPGTSQYSVYNQLAKSPAVIPRNRKAGSQVRKIAVFNPDYRKQLTRQDILTKDSTLLEVIQERVRTLLRNHPEHQLALSEVRDRVSEELHCPKASIYGAVSRMDDIEKFNHPEYKGYIIKLISPAHEFEKQISQIKDATIAGEVKRALSHLHIDAVDVALFQLGKLFEHVLKDYMVQVQQAGKIPVTAKDLSRLFNMVEWAGREGVISDANALHYLRIERNDRSHGAPPTLEERQVLLDNSTMLVNLYLDYIVLLSQRAAALH